MYVLTCPLLLEAELGIWVRVIPTAVSLFTRFLVNPQPAALPSIRTTDGTFLKKA